jgi:orotate phosphoribosyltransferase
MNSNDVSTQVADILLRLGAVTFSPEKPYTFTSGVQSPIYTDNRILISYPAERRIITRLLSERILTEIPRDAVDIVVGTATAGIPFAAWVAEYLDKPMAYVRSNAKLHGKMQKIEGAVRRGQRAVIIEDLISTGKSAISTAEELRSVGLVVEHCFAVFDYEFTDASDNLRAARLGLYPLCGIGMLAEMARSRGIISAHAYDIVLQWSVASGWKTSPSQ